MASPSPTSFLITGANQGLGFHAAQKLASQPSHIVFLSSRNFEAAQSAVAQIEPDKHASTQVVPIRLDVADDASIVDAKEEVSKSLAGRGLDVLVNNAAAMFDRQLPSLSVREMLRSTYDADVFGAAAVTEAFLPLLPLSIRRPRIVNVSSQLGSYLRPQR